MWKLIPVAENAKTKSNSQAAKKQNGASKKQRVDKKKDTKHTFSHPWLVSTLRGHSGLITGLDFSPNGKYVATCAEGIFGVLKS